MRIRKLPALASVLSVWLPVFASAQPGAPNPNPNPNPRPGVPANPGAGGGLAGGAWVGGNAAEAYIAGIEKTVALTDEQKKSIVRIIEARDAAIKIWQGQAGDQLKAAQAAMMEAYKAKDREAITKAQKDYQELYAPMHGIMKNSQADLDAVLTADQKGKLREAKILAAIRSMTESAKLTDEQMARAKEACEKAFAAGGERNLYQAIQDILTPEQKAAIAKARALASLKWMFAVAKLTPEQTEQAGAAWDELAKDETLDAPARYKAFQEKVRSLLTDEQKEALKKVGPYGQAGGLVPGGALRPQGNPQK